MARLKTDRAEQPDEVASMPRNNSIDKPNRWPRISAPALCAANRIARIAWFAAGLIAVRARFLARFNLFPSFHVPP